MPSIPLLTALENRTSSLAKDAKLVNGYGELKGQDRVFAVKRPGFTSDTVYVAAAAQGLHTYLDVLRVVVTNRFYTTSSTYETITNAAGNRVDFV